MNHDPLGAVGLCLATRFNRCVHGASVIAAIDARQQPEPVKSKKHANHPAEIARSLERDLRKLSTVAAGRRPLAVF
jgi:hypothetical protein